MCFLISNVDFLFNFLNLVASADHPLPSSVPSSFVILFSFPFLIHSEIPSELQSLSEDHFSWSSGHDREGELERGGQSTLLGMASLHVQGWF